MLYIFAVPIIPKFLFKLDKSAISVSKLNVEVKNASRSALFNNTDCSQVIDGNFLFVNELTDIIYICENTSTNINNASATDTLARNLEKARHNMLVDETVKVGLMFASKAIVQIMTNPLIGPLTNRYAVHFIIQKF